MSKQIIPVEQIARKILYLPNQKVLLDRDLAALYGVETRVLNQAVKRNTNRFPDDFVFTLSREEIARISQFVTSSGHDEEIAAILDAIRQLMAPPKQPRREIGFHVREKGARYRARNGR
jgi:hypothetical protein